VVPSSSWLSLHTNVSCSPTTNATKKTKTTIDISPSFFNKSNLQKKMAETENQMGAAFTSKLAGLNATSQVRERTYHRHRVRASTQPDTALLVKRQGGLKLNGLGGFVAAFFVPFSHARRFPPLLLSPPPSQSIETLSHWCVFHRKRAKALTPVWQQQLRAAPGKRKLNFLYLANDVMQNSRKKGMEWIDAFWPIMGREGWLALFTARQYSPCNHSDTREWSDNPTSSRTYGKNTFS
jgi:hypothetical protein